MVERAIASGTSAPPSGRLAVLTGLSLAASALPLPVVPDRILERIRGAIAQDVSARHGLSLTTDARRILAEPGSDSPARALIGGVVGMLAKTFVKRLSPLSALVTASAALEVYALGHLLDRYLRDHRATGAVRIHDDEARKLRRLIDAAFLRAFSPTLKPDPVPLLPSVEDLRDDFTRWIDTMLLVGSSAPSYLERRLDAALDALVAEGGARTDAGSTKP
jgi:hypothetical protein